MLGLSLWVSIRAYQPDSNVRVTRLPPATTSTTLGAIAPEVALPDLHGATHRLSELRGHKVMLNFWASWCHDCMQEMPLLDAAQRELGPSGFRLVGVGVDQTSAVAGVVRAHQPSYLTLIADDVGAEPSSGFGNREPTVLPFSVLIAADGRILKTWRGGFASQAELLAWISSERLSAGSSESAKGLERFVAEHPDLR